MSAKFAARALSRFGERNIIAIRTDAGRGHGIGSTRVQIIQEAADIYTFLLNRFGVDFADAADGLRIFSDSILSPVVTP